MKIDVISAANPRHIETDTDSVTLDVLFSHLPNAIPFAARKDDPEEYGRELYSRAVFGEFGPIEVITPPPPTEPEQYARLNRLLKQAATAMAPLLDAEELGIISDTERDQLTAWRRYRIALYRLPQSEDWPTVVSWPQAPL
jgi:hypothetical protein